MKCHGGERACGRVWGCHPRIAPDPAPRSRGIGRARPGRREPLAGRGDPWQPGRQPGGHTGSRGCGAYLAVGVGGRPRPLRGALDAAPADGGHHCGALVVADRSLLRGSTWREPLSNYREIRCQVEQQPHRYGRRSWYVVRLWHPEPAKRVELARARDPIAIEERARDCARLLGLPLVWEQLPAIMVDPAAVGGADHHVRGRVREEVAAAPGPGRSLSGELIAAGPSLADQPGVAQPLGRRGFRKAVMRPGSPDPGRRRPTRA